MFLGMQIYELVVPIAAAAAASICYIILEEEIGKKLQYAKNKQTLLFLLCV